MPISLVLLATSFSDVRILSESDGAAGCPCLSSSSTSLPNNNQVVLAGKTLTDPALLEAMSAGLDGNVTSLESMVLARCELGDVAMEELSHALQEHPTLVALDLSDNGIGQAGAEALSLIHI